MSTSQLDIKTSFSRKRGLPARDGEAAGFTLIEVMIALFIVALAFVALLGLHNANLAAVGRDQDLTVATLIARRLITQMELVEQFPDVGFSSGQIEDYPGFRWEREVKETFQPDLREVHLRVVWDERIPDACRLLYFIRDHREPETSY
jgi:general secretion pathway protein I